MRLKNKVAVVTGGGTGIGKSVCRTFAKQGAKVVVVGNERSTIEKTTAEILEAQGEAIAVQADVSSSFEVKRVFTEAVHVFGKLDVLVNNAAVQLYGTVETMQEEDWEKIFSVNAKGYFLCMKHAVPYLKANGGSIINMGSATGLIGIKNLFAYSATKGAIHAMTRSAAVELAPYGIRVNAIAPGTILTPLLDEHIRSHAEHPETALAEFNEVYPVGRLGKPEEVSMACVYLASDESCFTTGSVMVIDGGYTIRGIHP